MKGEKIEKVFKEYINRRIMKNNANKKEKIEKIHKEKDIFNRIWKWKSSEKKLKGNWKKKSKQWFSNWKYEKKN